MERLLQAEADGALFDAAADEEVHGYGMVADNPLVGDLQAALAAEAAPAVEAAEAAEAVEAAPEEEEPAPMTLAQRMAALEMSYGIVEGNEDNSPFTDWLVSDNAAPAAVNCWEAILYAAVEQGLVTKAALAEVAQNSPNDRSSTRLATNVLNYSGSEAVSFDEDDVPTNVNAGDVIFIMGLSHVVLARDAQGGVTQLWGARQRETTIADVLQELRGAADVAQLRAAAYDAANYVRTISGDTLDRMYGYEDDAAGLLAFLIDKGFVEVRVAHPQWP